MIMHGRKPRNNVADIGMILCHNDSCNECNIIVKHNYIVCVGPSRIILFK